MKRAILIPLLAATAMLAPRLAAAQAAGCTDLCVPAGTPDGARLDALVITDAASPGMRMRMDVVEPPYIAP